MPQNYEKIIPGAVTVAVTSGKGGVGKTTTAVALATAVAALGHDVILIDGDVHGPNVHIVAGVKDRTLGVEKETLTLTLPTSPLGFRIASPVSITESLADARVTVSDLISMVRFAAPAQVIIVDLPPGWTDGHDAICGSLPDLVITVVAPTWPSISDHRKHSRAWKASWKRAVQAHRDRDKRRKLDLPEVPNFAVAETMARFVGIPETGGEPVTVRRIDAVDAAKVTELVNPTVSIPSAASIQDSAAGTEIGELAAHVDKLITS